MYKLHISHEAKRQLRIIAKATTNEIVIAALREIRDEPFLGKPLSKDLTGGFTYKLEVYRIIYTVDKKDKTVNIFAAGHRATIY